MVHTRPTKSLRDGGGSAGKYRRKRCARRRTVPQARSSDPASTATASTARVAPEAGARCSRTVPLRLPNQATTTSSDTETVTGTPPKPAVPESRSESKECWSAAPASTSSQKQMTTTSAAPKMTAGKPSAASRNSPIRPTPSAVLRAGRVAVRDLLPVRGSGDGLTQPAGRTCPAHTVRRRWRRRGPALRHGERCRSNRVVPLRCPPSIPNPPWIPRELSGEAPDFPRIPRAPPCVPPLCC